MVGFSSLAFVIDSLQNQNMLFQTKQFGLACRESSGAERFWFWLLLVMEKKQTLSKTWQKKNIEGK
ncbi:MAG: hypothetical protein K8F91_25275 [Candidatus Obscuribacterales bacterium]|nr:hypothetical protein [Candidatus Obscuribacterales bacterium]